MKKVLKIVGVIGVVVLLVLGVSSTALHFLLPPEKAKALVLKQLTAHLKREVKIGDVSVGLLTGLDVSDLKVSESPDFSRGTFISSDHFSIRLALLPLVFRKVVVKQLTLTHPEIRIVRKPDGKTFNFSDLMPADTSTGQRQVVPPGPGTSSAHMPSAPADAKPAVRSAEGEPPFLLVVSRAQIQGGVVHFLDQSPAQQSVDIDPLDLKLNNVSLTAPFSVQAFLKAKARNVVATLKLAGEADLATGSFKVKNCSLSSGGSTLTLAGKASQLKSNRPSMDLTLDLTEFKLSTLAAFATLPPALKLEGPILAHARMKGDQEKIDFSAKIDLDKVLVAYAQQFSKPANVPMGITMSGDIVKLRDLNLTELKAVLGSLQAKAHGKVLGVTSEEPQVNLHLETNDFPVNELADFAAASFPKGLSIKGRAQLAADVSGTQASSHFAAKCDGKSLEIEKGEFFRKPAGTPLRVSMVGEMIQSVVRAAAPASKRKGSTAAVKSSGQVVNFQSLSATVGSLEVNGNGSVHTGGASPRIQLAFKSNAFSLQEMAKMVPLLAEYKPTGTASTDVRASGTLDDPIANGALTLQDASIHYEQSELSHLATALTFTQQDVTIPKLTGKLNGSDVQLKLVGHRLTTQPEIFLEGNITELDLAKLLPPMDAPPPTQTSDFRMQNAGVLQFAICNLNGVATAWAAAPPAAVPPMKLDGHLVVGHIKHEFYDAKDLDVKWNLTNVTPDLGGVNGTAALKQGAGMLKDVEKLAQYSKSAKIALLPIATLQKLEKNGFLKGIGIPSLKKIPFDSIRGDYLLRDGVMTVKAFDLLARDLNVNTTGTIGLAGVQPLNLRVVMKLAPGSLGGDLGQFTQDESGRPTLPFTVKGTASSPEVKADLQDIGRKALQKYGGDLLKGLGIGQPAAPPPASNNATDGSQAQPNQPAAPAAPQPNPVDDLQKAFKNIFH